jgi:hypothetical protein
MQVMFTHTGSELVAIKQNVWHWSYKCTYLNIQQIGNSEHSGLENPRGGGGGVVVVVAAAAVVVCMSVTQFKIASPLHYIHNAFCPTLILNQTPYHCITWYLSQSYKQLNSFNSSTQITLFLYSGHQPVFKSEHSSIETGSFLLGPLELFSTFQPRPRPISKSLCLNFCVFKQWMIQSKNWQGSTCDIQLSELHNY